jgi:hypothetical protein
VTDTAQLIAGESLLLAAAGLVSYGLYPHDPAIPEGVPCPFCGVEYPLTGIVQHMLTRGRCKGRKVSLRVGSTQRRRW